MLYLSNGFEVNINRIGCHQITQCSVFFVTSCLCKLLRIVPAQVWYPLEVPVPGLAADGRWRHYGLQGPYYLFCFDFGGVGCILI